MVFVNKKKNDWDDYFFYLMMVYRVIVYEFIKCFVNLIMLGWELFLYIDIMVGFFFGEKFDFCLFMYVVWV